MNVIKDWFTRYFSDPQAIVLSVLILLGLGIVLFIGDFLAPVLVSLVLAYLLEGVVRKLVDLGAQRERCIMLVYLIFLASLIFIILGLSPLLWTQVVDLIGELPNYLKRGQEMLMALPQNYSFISEAQIQEVVQLMQQKIAAQGQYLLSLSLSSIPGLFTLIVYFILVPLLVFFFLKDKQLLLKWFVGFLPKERKLSSRVWDDVNLQIGNYIRGKFWGNPYCWWCHFYRLRLHGIEILGTAWGNCWTFCTGSLYWRRCGHLAGGDGRFFPVWLEYRICMDYGSLCNYSGPRR